MLPSIKKRKTQSKPEVMLQLCRYDKAFMMHTVPALALCEKVSFFVLNEIPEARTLSFKAFHKDVKVKLYLP